MGLIQRSDRRRSALNRAEQRLRFSAKAILLLKEGGRRRLALHTPQPTINRQGYFCRGRSPPPLPVLGVRPTVAHAVLGLSVTHPPNNVFFPAKPLMVAGMRSLCSAL